jgi:hypothetical protein
VGSSELSQIPGRLCFSPTNVSVFNHPINVSFKEANRSAGNIIFEIAGKNPFGNEMIIESI